MAIVWNPWGTLGLVAVVVCSAVAVAVYRAGPRLPVNRWLASLLFLEGLLVTSCDDGLGLFVTDAHHYVGTAAVHAVLHVAFPFLYLAFLGVALETPLVRPLRGRRAVAILLGLLALAQAYRFARPEMFVAGIATPWFAPWALVPGPAFVWTLRFSALVAAFGLVATLDSWRRARSVAARERARAYALAFAFRDLYWVVLLLVVFPTQAAYTSVAWGIVFTQSMPILTMAFVALLAYGMLKTQVLDIDLRIKMGLRRSAVAAAFVAAFVVASEAVELLVSGTAGTLAGIAAAGVLAFALRPLEGAAGRLAERLMPGADGSPAYRDNRRRDVYGAAVEDALRDGTITDDERDTLALLAQKLGLGPADARAIERGAADTGSGARRGAA